MKRRNNGEGSIKELPDGRVTIRMQVGYNPNGNPRIITVTAESKAAAIKQINKRKSEIENNFITTDKIKKITLTDLCQLHFAAHLKEKDRLKPKSADRRECTINNQIKPYSIGLIQVANVTSNDVETHIEGLIKTDLSVSSIRKTLDVINSAYNWAIAQNYLNYNPCTAVRDKLLFRLKNISAKHSTDADVVVLSDEELALIKNAATLKNVTNNDYHHTIGLYVLFLIETGMRIGELCALKWGDYNDITGTLNISTTRYTAKNRKEDIKTSYTTAENIAKNAQAREIALSEPAKDILKYLKSNTGLNNDDDYILLNRDKKPTNPVKVDKRINTFYEAAGLDNVSGAHILRRTFATRKHLDGAPVEKIAAYMGDLPSTVVKYYIATRKKIKQGDKTINIVPMP